MNYSTCNNKTDSIGKEYMHFELKNRGGNSNLTSSGIFYANGEKKIKDKLQHQHKQRGGSKVMFATPDNRLHHYKSNGYYLDFNNVIGGRPVLVTNDLDIPNNITVKKPFNKHAKFNCFQPFWTPSCL